MEKITIKLTAEELNEIVFALNDRATKYAKYASDYGIDFLQTRTEMCDNLGDKLNAILYTNAILCTETTK